VDLDRIARQVAEGDAKWQVTSMSILWLKTIRIASGRRPLWLATFCLSSKARGNFSKDLIPTAGINAHRNGFSGKTTPSIGPGSGILTSQQDRPLLR